MMNWQLSPPSRVYKTPGIPLSGLSFVLLHETAGENYGPDVKFLVFKLHVTSRNALES